MHGNTCVSPILRYPCLLCRPSPAGLRTILAAGKRFLFTGRWALWTILPAMGILFQVKGSPRHPHAVIDASTILQWLRGQSWCPPGFKDSARLNWAKCVQWAATPDESAAPWGVHTAARQKAKISALAARLHPWSSKDLRQAGIAVHEAMWPTKHPPVNG